MPTRARKSKPIILRQSKAVAALTEELRREHRCHTVILYGSRARGDHSPQSDYDLLGIRKNGAVRHLARRMGRAYVDAFVYPERKVRTSELLRIQGGRVLFEKRGFGEALLRRVNRRYALGPKALNADEKAVLKHWAQKMLIRATKADTEGHFRRAWLLTALLEDYFALRGLWYEGPKLSLRWLQHHDPAIASLFAKALSPDAPLSHIATLAAAVTAAAP